MTTGMTRRDFAHATAVALIIAGAICTAAVADDVKRISANGTELTYVEAGQGEPVIFVHGGLQDYRMWAGHLPKFAGRYRAIAYSRRNHFPNAVGLDGLPDGAADTHGEDLAAFVRALGLSKVRIVAHSSGAHAALFFAARHPDMLVSLALNAASRCRHGKPPRPATPSAPYLSSWMSSADRALMSAVPLPTRK